MRLNQPRLSPLTDEELPDAVKQAMGDGPMLNIFRTLAHHPGLMKRWLVFANHVLGKSTLAPRERELVILRIGWLCRSGYEWGQHVQIGLGSGLTQEEIDRIPLGARGDGWNDLERALLDATDELHSDAFVSAATWARLASLDDQQRIDLVFTVGQYNLVSMALNTLGVQPEPGLPEFPS
ncbi:MAG: carboxymuconolactone decarboxylase family protein [Myxococcota bacterium]|nr:carboxymuconolactone decarboxylase family protein [Myxococcota bacterium]